MNIKILNNELEFRSTIISIKDYIDTMYVYEDTLDNTIFFYCFTINKDVIATKVISNNNYHIYQKIYNDIKKELGLNITIENPVTLKLTKY